MCCYMLPQTRVDADSFSDSMITSLQFVIGEGWNEIMQEAIHEVDGHSEHSYTRIGLLTGPYFVANVFLGHYLLLGILLAIACTNLGHFIPDTKIFSLELDAFRSRSYSVVDQDHLPLFTSLYVFSSANRFRLLCLRITNQVKPHIWMLCKPPRFVGIYVKHVLQDKRPGVLLFLIQLRPEGVRSMI